MDHDLHVRLPSCRLFREQDGRQDGLVDVVALHAEDNGTQRDRRLHSQEEVQPSIFVARLPPHNDACLRLDSLQVFPR